MNRTALPFLLTFTLALAATAVQAQSREVEALNRICREALDSGDALRAAPVCKRMQEQVERLAPGTDAALTALRNLAELKRRQDNNLAADELYTEALALVDRTGRGETLLAADLLERQADAKIARGTIFEAEPGLRRAVALRDTLNGATSLEAAATRVRHATVLAMLAQYQGAHVGYRRALAVYERAGPALRGETLATRRLIAELLARQSRLSQAESELRRLLEDASATPRVVEQVVFALDQLAWIAAESGRRDDAIALYRRELAELGQAPANAESARLVRARLADLTTTGAAAP